MFERARAVMKTREPIVVRYDTGANADIVWGLGLGCNGVVHVLIEALDDETMPTHLRLLSDCIAGQGPGVIATVFGVYETHEQPHDSTPLTMRVGSRLLLNHESTVSELKHHELARSVMQDARAAINDSESSVKVYEIAETTVEVFIEFVEPPVPLVIFGANADAAPVLEVRAKTRLACNGRRYAGARQLPQNVSLAPTGCCCAARTQSPLAFPDTSQHGCW
ncbi:MAG: hypothetical protein WKF84_14225 [Pyrinomonadaceae bacterium]